MGASQSGIKRDIMEKASTNFSNGRFQSEKSNKELKDPIRRPGTNIILNHDFSGGLHLWHPNCCDGFVVSSDCDYPPGLSAAFNGCFAVITNRKECWQGLEQETTDRVSVGSTYTVCAWVKISGGSHYMAGVQATMKLEYQDSSVCYSCIGRTCASKERWEKIEGTFCLSTMPSRVIFYVEGPLPEFELHINSVEIFCASSGDSDSNKELKDPIRRPGTNIILNHDFSGGLHSWHPNCCDGFVVSSVCDYPPGLSSAFNGCFAVITNRRECWQGLEQEITDRVSVGSTYTVCAWVKISGGSHYMAGVQATMKLEYQDSSVCYSCIGRTCASKERWEKIEGTFCLSTMPSRVIFYVEGPLPEFDLHISSVEIFCASSGDSDDFIPLSLFYGILELNQCFIFYGILKLNQRR
ncbi:hypothetical protein ACS0TY_030083 [Phlomoides rotata]